MSATPRLALAVAACLLVVAPAGADETGPAAPPVAGWVEPPPEEPEGADYDLERADSLDQGAVELGVGASGRAGARPRQSRRLRFSDGGASGSVREGAGDALAGGTIETDTPAGRVGLGRLAPRWGRGLLLGAAADPWSVLADDRGAGVAFRGRSGRGAWCRAGQDGALETLCGRFGRHDLAGAHAPVGPLSCGALGDRAGHTQASVALAVGRADHEVAVDRAGRWRAESALLAGVGGLTLAARVRGGLAAFRSLAEPSRNGPAQALACELRDASPWGALRAQAALWRFGSARGGARAALEVSRALNHHGLLAAGLEERHGAPRESGRVPGFRQGGWAEWHGEAAGLSLALRHEVLGAERLGRAAVRTITAARVGIEGPGGSSLSITHCAYRVRAGETLHLIESSSDRIVLRAVSGTGQRTRVELRAPGAGGRIEAALDLPCVTDARAAERRPRWTLEWTRRARSRSPG
jgi:hypothetical protein